MHRTSPADDAEECDAPDLRDARPSKSALKREMTSLQKLGEALVAQPPERLDRVDMPDALRDAIREAQRIRDHEGRRRQLQYVGRLMRDVDPAPLREAMDAWTGASRADVARLHAVERWRERLLDDDAALTAFATEHTAALNPATMQRLRSTIRLARANASPRHARELFRSIRAIVDEDGAS